MRALIVDDSIVMRRVLAGALSRLDITDCDQAGDGGEAIKLAGKNEYDIILMNWNMPRLSGIEAVKAIRANGIKTPIIMVTTEAEKMRIVEAVKAGAQDYVIKPFKPETIIAKIADALHLKR